jgi:hypothetical protein
MRLTTSVIVAGYLALNKAVLPPKYRAPLCAKLRVVGEASSQCSSATTTAKSNDSEAYVLPSGLIHCGLSAFEVESNVHWTSTIEMVSDMNGA